MKRKYFFTSFILFFIINLNSYTQNVDKYEIYIESQFLSFPLGFFNSLNFTYSISHNLGINGGIGFSGLSFFEPTDAIASLGLIIYPFATNIESFTGFYFGLYPFLYYSVIPFSDTVTTGKYYGIEFGFTNIIGFITIKPTLKFLSYYGEGFSLMPNLGVNLGILL